MGMSLEEIVFLFTVSGLPWPPSRSVSASLHLYGGGARRSGAGRFSQCLKGAVSAPWCISWICISACFHVWAHTICIPQKHLYSGVDPSSVGVHDHLYVSELATMYVNPLPSFFNGFLYGSGARAESSTFTRFWGTCTQFEYFDLYVSREVGSQKWLIKILPLHISVILQKKQQHTKQLYKIWRLESCVYKLKCIEIKSIRCNKSELIRVLFKWCLKKDNEVVRC